MWRWDAAHTVEETFVTKARQRCNHPVNWYVSTLDTCYQSVMVDETPIQQSLEGFTG